MITTQTSGVWDVDDVYKKVNAGYLGYTGAPSLFAWGNNYRGALGQSNTIRYSSPIQIPGTQWSSVSDSSEHILALKSDGTLWAWGQNSRGELGQNNIADRSSPVQIPGTQWRSISASGNSVACASLATKTDGTLWAWGNNSGGNLGQNDRVDRSSPVQIPGTSWNSINNASSWSLATKTDGTLWAWGANFFGYLAQNDRAYRSSPVQIPGTQWNRIEIGTSLHALATKTDGTLWAWGWWGGLGQNNISISQSSPVQIPGTQWSSIAAGDEYSLATKTDGTLWAWGRPSPAVGQLGQNDLTPYSSPVQIPGTSWSSISGADSHVLARKTDGTLWSWGGNYFGQLGQNNRTQYSSPVQIPGTQWISIAASNSQSLGFNLQ